MLSSLSLNSSSLKYLALDELMFQEDKRTEFAPASIKLPPIPENRSDE